MYWVLNNSIPLFSLQMVLFTGLSTYLGFLEPSFNAFFLLSIGIPATGVLVHNLRTEEDPRVTSLGKRSIVLWVCGVFCWASDIIFCDVWLNLGFPYLHGFWHVLVFLATYTASVLLAYYDVKNNYPLDQAVIRYDDIKCYQFYIQ